MNISFSRAEIQEAGYPQVNIDHLQAELAEAIEIIHEWDNFARRMQYSGKVVEYTHDFLAKHPEEVK